MTGTLIEAVLNNLMALFPFLIVRSYQRGVRWKFGKNPVELLPGFRLRIWLIHSVEVFDIADEALPLPMQSVITKDEKLVCFQVAIGFRVVDVVSHACSVQDFVESTGVLAMTHLAERVRKKTLSELVADLKDLEKSLEGTLTTRMKGWGTEVFSVGFITFAEVPHQMRVFLDGDQKVIPIFHGG
jgi:regulator of protease activity HflC (stomatin/prohibitin superfamily)